MVTPVEDDVLDVAQPAAPRPEAQHEVVVLRPADLAVRDRARAREERRMADRALDEQILADPLGGGQRVQPPLVAAQTVGRLGEVPNPAAARLEALLSQRGQLQLEPPRPGDVVAAHRGQVCAPGLAAGALRRCDEPLRLLAHDAEAPVAPRPVLGDVRRCIARAVVDHDHLEVLVRLRGQRAERLVQIGLAVAHRDEHGDERRHGRCRGLHGARLRTGCASRQPDAASAGT